MTPGDFAIVVDMFRHMFQMQSVLNDRIIRERKLRPMTEDNRNHWMKKVIQAIQAELTELLDELNWKWWKQKKPLNQERIKEELVDVLHFFITACLAAGLTADEVYKAYWDKNRENHHRQDGNSRAGYAPESE